MTDLLHVLPDFETKRYTHLLPSLDRSLITVNDLLTLDASEVARRAQLPAAELRKLTEAVIAALHGALGFGEEDVKQRLLTREWRCVSTLDEKLDRALGGGVPPGYLVEITGESGAGKTQLLLTLLLSAQLPAPQGLGKSTIYISTEAPLSTPRLTQLLSSHPLLSSLPATQKPSLSRILSIQTPDLESQEHILRYQLPVAIAKHDIGLVVLDSVAANFRAEFEKDGGKGSGTGSGSGASMARRSAQLVSLGALLRDIATSHDVAVVVANQVADRFTRPLSPQSSSQPPSRTPSTTTNSLSQPSRPSQPTPSSASAPHRTHTPTPSSAPAPAPAATQTHPLSLDPLALDHQQRFFTGWGDHADARFSTPKTPSLGLVWTNQLACRIALVKAPVLALPRREQAGRVLDIVRRVAGVGGEEGEGGNADEGEERQVHVERWRRWVRVVFAPWVKGTEGVGVEIEIVGEGVRSVVREARDNAKS